MSEKPENPFAKFAASFPALARLGETFLDQPGRRIGPHSEHAGTIAQELFRALDAAAEGYADAVAKAISSPITMILTTPPGWRLVPIEPTEQMVSAGVAEQAAGRSPRNIIYAAIEAAPTFTMESKA